MSGFDLPVLCVQGPNLPYVWETAVVQTWEQGAQFRTQYDKPDDPPSRDATVCLAVADPFAEPRLHRAMPGGIDDLEVYTQEVVEGIHDSWIDPEAGKWQYTYHERLTSYQVPGREEPVDQLQYVVDTLAQAPYSRRAQAILWKPWEDGTTEHPACLQRLWFRVYEGRLVMNSHMRSNDAFRAAFMNMYAFTELQKSVARRLGERLGEEIRVGQYTHLVDSFHIYGSEFEDFRGFLTTLEKRSFEERTYTSEMVAPLFEEAREKIARKEAQRSS
jgi:thymidylate synthase